jgi:hypothetical protein
MSRTQTPGSDERWAQAFDMARGIVDEQRVRRTRRKVLLWLTMLLGVCAAIGVAGGLYLLQLDVGRSGEGDTEFSAAELVGFSLVIFGILLGVVGFVWAKKTGRYITRWRSVISPLNIEEQKLAQKQVAGKAEVDSDKLPVLTALARQNQRVSIGMLPFSIGPAVSGIGLALLLDNVLFWILELAIAASTVLVVVMSLVAHRRASRFLARYDDVE